MAGKLIERGDKVWLVRVFAGKVGGRRKYVSRTVHGTKREARQRCSRRCSETATRAPANHPNSGTLEKNRPTWSRKPRGWLAVDSVCCMFASLRMRFSDDRWIIALTARCRALQTGREV